jgi:hypothetical protein
MKRFLQDLDTIFSYYPFSLYSSALSSTMTLRTFVVFGTQPRRASKFFKKRKIGVKFCQCEIDANLIWVAPECRDIAGLARLYRGTFGERAYF